MKRISALMALIASMLPISVRSAPSAVARLPEKIVLEKKADGFWLHLPIASIVIGDSEDSGLRVYVNSSGNGEVRLDPLVTLTDEAGKECDGWRPCVNPVFSAYLEIVGRFAVPTSEFTSFKVRGPGRYRVIYEISAKNRKGEVVWLRTAPVVVEAGEK